MATKKASARALAKRVAPSIDFVVAAPCCSPALDLVFEGTVFSAEINGTTFNNVKTISLTSADPMTVLGLTAKGVFTNFDPWRVYIVKGRPGQRLVFKGGEITAKATKAAAGKSKPTKKK